MTLSTQPYKGARDFYPEDKRVQKYMFQVMRDVVERFGYEEYDAPLLEPLELYLSKTSEEVVNEQTYAFEDRGGRKVTIRPEMTPSVSRMVAGRRQELAYPARWYSIPNLWRYERPQRGRLREHWQLNVDVFGIAGIEADHEVIQVADSIMQAFGAPRDTYTIRINSRELVNSFLHDVLQLTPDQSAPVIRLIDRMHKMERSAFNVAVAELVGEKQTLLVAFLDSESVAHLPNGIKDHASVGELLRLERLLQANGVLNVKFDPTLMRGFDYYTDIVFEVFDTDPENNRSMFGGGRYDGLVGLFGVDPVPTVGFGMGDVTLQNFLESHGLLPELKPETDLAVILLGDVYEQAQVYLKQLRQAGINVTVDSTGRKPDKQIKSVVKKDIPFALFIGEAELTSGQFTIKQLSTGAEEKHSLTEIISHFHKNG